jgi:hypothetical protein
LLVYSWLELHCFGCQKNGFHWIVTLELPKSLVYHTVFRVSSGSLSHSWDLFLQYYSYGWNPWISLDRYSRHFPQHSCQIRTFASMALAEVSTLSTVLSPTLTLDRLIHVHRSWHYAQEMREALGEVYLIISPGQIFMSSSNAEANIQLTGRRQDFLKPVEIYAIVDIFGPSILTTEGPEWKRHRKIVAPAFSEKSNSLVWKESLRQSAGMLKVWSRLDGNGPGNMKVTDTAPYTSLMALHVISAAGKWKSGSLNSLAPSLWDSLSPSMCSQKQFKCVRADS